MRARSQFGAFVAAAILLLTSGAAADEATAPDGEPRPRGADDAVPTADGEENVSAAIRRHHEELVAISSAAGGLNSGIRLNEAGDRAARYLLSAFDQAGLESPQLETFHPNRWWPEEYAVTLLGSGQTAAQPLVAFPLWHCTGAPEKELEVVHVGFGTRGEFRGKDVEGKAVLVDMKRILHFWPTYVFTKALETAKEEGAKAVLVADTRVDAPSGNVVGSSGLIANKRAGPADLYELPVFSLGKSDGDRVRARAAEGDARVRLHLKVSMSQATAANVVGRLPGNDDATETIVIGGHYDSWFDGAIDNLGSQAVMIALAEHLARIPRSQRTRHVMFVSLFGHEFGNAEMGHAAFVQQHPELAGNTTVFIDVDGSGSMGWEEVADTGRIEPTGIDDKGGVFASSWTLAALAHEAIYRYSQAPWGSFPLNTLVADLHGPIGEAGYPHLLIISKHIYYHTPLDTLDRIEPDHTYRRYQMLVDVIEKILESPPGHLMGVDANPHGEGDRRGAAVDLTADDVPANPTPWVDGAPTDLDIHVIPDHVRVLSPVIAWTGRWRSDAILTPASFQWQFGSVLERIRGGGSNVVAGTMYLFPGEKTITLTVTDSQGRTTSISRQITVHAGALYWIAVVAIALGLIALVYLIFRLVRRFRRRRAARRAAARAESDAVS